MYKKIEFQIIKEEEELEETLSKAIAISSVVEYDFGDYQIKQSYLYKKDIETIPVSQHFFDLALLLNIKQKVYYTDIIEYVYKSNNLEKKTSHKPSPFRAESSSGQF
jgi:chromosome condensin MukBEF ATPase and DNA-binding subunit MukB